MANIIVEMSGDEAKLFRSFQKVQQQQQKMEQGLAKTGQAGEQAGRKIKKAGDDGAKAFGPSALSSLKSYAGGFLTISAAAGATLKVLNDIRDRQKEIAAGQREALASSGSLAQLAGGDAGKLDRLRAMALQTFAEGGAKTRDEANKQIFELESAGIANEANRRFFSQLSLVESETTPTIQAVGKMQSAFGAEAGSAKDIVSKAFGAAGPVTGASPSAMLTATLPALASARNLGLSDEEVMAAVSLLAQQSKSPDVGGTQFASLLTSLEKKGFAEQHGGKGLGAMLEAVREMNMDTPGQIEFFGRQEAQRGFAGLEPGVLQERLAAIRQAEAGAADAAIQNNLRASGALIAERSMTNLSQSQDELMGSKHVLANAVIEATDAAMAKEGHSIFSRTMQRWGAQMGRFTPGLGDDWILGKRPREEIVAELGMLGRNLTGGARPAAPLPPPAAPDLNTLPWTWANPQGDGAGAGELRAAADKIGRAAEAMERAASTMHAGPTRRGPLDDK